MPTLIAVAHGTRSPAGQAQIRDLAARVARRRPGLDVRLCYVDVQEPRIAEVARLIPDAVVVPLLLSAGYHVRVDIADAVAGRAIPVSLPLGPDDLLRDSLLNSLPPADAVVLAAAGSSDPAWRADVQALAADLQLSRSPAGRPHPRRPGLDRRGHATAPGPGETESSTASRADTASVDGVAAGGPLPYADRRRHLGVHVGYVSGPGPRVAEVVAGLRARGARRIAVAAYFLADGLFYRTLRQAGADHVTPPLCHDPAVIDLVLRRYDSVLTTAPARL